MRLDAAAFAEFFTAVHGHGPLPWQQDLAERLLAGEEWPAGVDVATGLGKTSLIDIAVFAAAAGAPAARRRTFFIVDRRLVVDEAYDHARTLAAALADPAALDCGDQQRTTVEQVAELLRPDHGAEPLEAARMRGGTTWDWRWVKRPDAPAVVVGTVDQIGSRLLMRGYGLGPHLAPIDAALVGTDSLIVCDEAHLSAPLLQTLNTAVQQDARLAAPVVVTMSATAPPVHRGRVHTTTAADAAHPVAGARLNSPRRLHLAAPKSSRAVAEQMAAWAHGLAQQPGPGRVVLSVCNTVARARAVFTTLGGLGVAEDDRVLLIGRSRPIDRDHLIATAYEHMRLGRDRTRDNTLHVVATQTVEVGANIDADALVSESASYSALVQRLGRVGRAPDIHPAPDFPAVVVHDPTATDEDPVYGPARNATWAWLRTLTDPVAVRKGAHSAQALDGGGISASPLQLAELRRGLSEEEKQAMEAPGSYIPHLWQGTLRLWARTAPRPYPDPPVAPTCTASTAGRPTSTSSGVPTSPPKTCPPPGRPPARRPPAGSPRCRPRPRRCCR
ncbi:type I-U CRISPR-associated helicase/endonuclease Cas3 [Nocardiopsis composta]